MAKSRDVTKERFWRRLIRRHVASGLGTRRFCAQEGIPEHRYHWWRRILRERDQQDEKNSKRRDLSRHGDLCTATGGESAFLPVHLPLSLGAPIEIVHPRGHVVRVPAVFDPAVLQRVLATLDLPEAS